MEIIEVNWNIGKSNKQIKKVDAIIESYIDSNGEFNPDLNKFSYEMNDIGYSWANEENLVNNIALDDLYINVYNILKGEGVFNIPHAGTLLGFHRDNESIQHDDDHDISVDYSALSDKFEIVSEKLAQVGLSFWWNSKIINEGLDFSFCPWTKICTPRKFRVHIGSYSFLIRHCMDLFPIVKFNDFNEFLTIIENLYFAYKYNGKHKWAFGDLTLKLAKRKKKISNFFGSENFDKLLNFANELESDISPDEKKANENLSRLNELMKKNGKYFTTIDFQIIYKLWRKVDGNFIEKNINSNLQYFSIEKNDELDLEIFFGDNWNINPKIGPLHVFIKQTFEGKKKNR